MVKRMDPGEFRRLGYLQEVNRCFLHPLGLALEVVTEADGTTTFGEVWDYRDDPEGMIFGEPAALNLDAVERIMEERDAKIEARRQFGCDDEGVQQIHPMRLGADDRDTLIEELVKVVRKARDRLGDAIEEPESDWNADARIVDEVRQLLTEALDWPQIVADQRGA